MTAVQTVYHRLAATAHRWPDRPFVVVVSETARAYGMDGPVSLTYGDVLARVDRLADKYAGYGPGHRVGLLLENRPDFLLHWLALNKRGACIVPINPDLKQADLSYLINHSGMVSACATEDRISDLGTAAPELPTYTPDGSPPNPAAPAQPTPDAECAILYTSGTTGLPKGCVLTNRYFLHCGDWYASVGGALTIKQDPPERMLTPLPLFHVNALAFSVMGMMTVGGSISVLDRFHPSTWWDSVIEVDATCIHYLGLTPQLLMKQPATDAERNNKVRFGFGAGIEPGLHAAAEARFGFPLVEGWAMTETGAGGVIMATEDPRPVGKGCFGRPRNGVEIQVLRDDGTQAANGEHGELLVRRTGADPRQYFFREYLNDPEATAEAWLDGWLHTGDIVTHESDGYLRFIDRKKNIVRRSGENISAAEVEALLIQHPAIKQVAVAPVPDDLRGEEVMALIVGHHGEPPISIEQVAAFAREKLAYFKAPGWIAFVDGLPVTATAKLQRAALRDLALDKLSTAHDVRHLKKRVA